MRLALILTALLLALPAHAQRAPCAERFDVHATMMAPGRVLQQNAFYSEPDATPPAPHRTSQRAPRPAARACYLT